MVRFNKMNSNIGKEIGIVGFGQFGQFMAEHLKDNFDIFVYDKNKAVLSEAKKLGVRFSSLKEAASKKIVVAAVPISIFKQSLLEIKPFLEKGTLLLDVCSVKQEPVKLMKKIVPGDVEILGTHPLFGPQSGKSGIKGLKIVLCPIRISENKLQRVESFLEKAGLKVIKMTPREHDRQAAKSQALAHFVINGLAKFGIHKQDMKVTTRAFEQLVKAVELVTHDSPQLFEDMQTANSLAAGIREKFINELTKIDKSLRR